MLLGHTGMNWALKHAPAYVVNLTLLGEPIGATIIAAMLPGIREIPGPATWPCPAADESQPTPNLPQQLSEKPPRRSGSSSDSRIF